MPSVARYTRPVRAENTVAAEVTPASPEVTNRPKVMRRPANFSAATASRPMPFEPLPADLLPTPPTHAAARSWQDDGRFGLAMLVVVMMVNLLLTLAFSSPQAAKEVETTIIQSSGDPRAHATTVTESSPVTIYAQPVAQPAAVQLLDFEEAAPALMQHPLSNAR